MGRAGAVEFELLTPRPGVTILARHPETHLVLRYSESQTAIQVRVEKSGIILNPVQSVDGMEYLYLHFRLPLKPGPNIFTIVPTGRQLEFTYKPLQALLPQDMKKFFLFHQDDRLPESCVDCHDLQDTTTIDLVGLKQDTSCIACHTNIIDKNPWQHSASANQQCLSCHLQFVKPWRIGFRAGKIDTTCLTCHTGKKIWLVSKHRHGAMIGGCTLCHNPHGSKHRYQLWAENSLQICVSCHADKKNIFDQENPLPYIHGIIFGKGCVACHNPHASDEEFMLLKPINELCRSCHPSLAAIKRGHPVAGHPLSGPKERRRPDRRLTCIGCHNPHASSHKYLLIETKQGGLLCRVCHKR